MVEIDTNLADYINKNITSIGNNSFENVINLNTVTINITADLL